MEVESFKTIVCFGDSLTQQGFNSGGWLSMLGERYQRRADVFNRGFSGYNTRMALKVADSVLRQVPNQSSTLFATIFLGANDAADAQLNPVQHVPVPEYKENLKQLVSKFREHLGAKVPLILISPPPVVERLWFERMKEKNPDVFKTVEDCDRQNSKTVQYADACMAIAQELSEVHVHGLNLFSEIKSTANWEELFSDGVHFNTEGNRRVNTILIEFLERVCPDITVTPCEFRKDFGNSGSKSKLEHVGPWWDETTEEMRKPIVPSDCNPPPTKIARTTT